MPEDFNSQDNFVWRMNSQTLTSAQVKDFRLLLQSEPNNFESRLSLLGWYEKRQTSSRGRFMEQLLWMIDHHPANAALEFLQAKHPEDYALAKQHWLKQVEANPVNAAVLSNAAGFISQDDFKGSEKLLQTASKLEPTSCEYPRLLSRLYLNELQGEGLQKYAQDSAAAMLKALDIHENCKGDCYLSPYAAMETSLLAEMLLNMNFPAEAKTLAIRLLPKNAPKEIARLQWMTQYNAYPGYAAHSLLGRIAISENDIQRAKEHLAKQVLEPSPKMPDLSLAGMLLDLNENEAVLEFLKSCRVLFENWLAHVSGPNSVIRIEWHRRGIPNALSEQREHEIEIMNSRINRCSRWIASIEKSKPPKHMMWTK